MNEQTHTLEGEPIDHDRPMSTAESVAFCVTMLGFMALMGFVAWLVARD